MCTVTVVWAADRVRLACNRDERRSRADALPPTMQTFGPRRALLPIDPVGGGTWVAVNDAGLALTVLNVTQQPRVLADIRKSRGTIIPALLSASSLDAALHQAQQIEPRDYAPFRIVLVDHAAWAEVYSDGICLTARRGTSETPMMFTSSGLGDDLVAGLRGELFREQFGRTDHLRAQDRFHRHRWRDWPHLSVCMQREEARTVSHTVVTLRPERVLMCYHPDAPDTPAVQTFLSLDTHRGGQS